MNQTKSTLFFFVFLLQTVICIAQVVERPNLKVSKGSNSKINITWASYPGVNYELQSSSSLITHEWKPARSLIRARGTNVSIELPVDSGVGFFRVVQKDIAGNIALSEGQTLTGNTTVLVTNVFAADGLVQYIALLDVVEGHTNVLGWRSDILSNQISFDIDSRKMKSGVNHQLVLLLVDDCGDINTGNGVRVVYSEPVTVRANNPLSLNAFGDTEWKFHLSFSSEFTEGSWRVTLRQSSGFLYRDFRGDIATSLDSNNEIIVQDIGRGDIGVSYPENRGDYFLVDVSVTNPEGKSYSISTQSRIIRRPNFSSMVIEEGGTTNWSVDVRFNTEFMFSSITATMALLGDHVRLSDGSKTDTPKDWNRVSFLDLNSFESHMASHVYIRSEGRPNSIGSVGMSSSFLSDPSLNKVIPTFVFIDGHNAPFAFLSKYMGIGTLTLDDVLVKGKFPRFGIYFVGRDYPSGLSDIPTNEAAFVEDLINELYRVSSISGMRRCGTYGEILEKVLMSSPESSMLRSTLRTVGCAELYVDE